MAKSKTPLTFYGGVNEIGGRRFSFKMKTKEFLWVLACSLPKKVNIVHGFFQKAKKSLLELEVLPKREGF